MPVITRLLYYPVKSLAGIAASELDLTPRGFVFDREWMLVDEAGAFITQRFYPRLCLVKTGFDSSCLTLSADGFGELRVPLERTERSRRMVTVWKDACEALDEGDAAAQWLSSFAGVSCRLVRIAPEFRRLIKERFARPGDWTAFADGYPVLGMTEESLADLSARCGQALEAERFRANIVLSGQEAWAEDQWSELRFGSLALRAAKPCARCAITTVDPKTGVMGPEPLRGLAQFRREPDGRVLFGVNLIPDGSGQLRVGQKGVIIKKS